VAGLLSDILPFVLGDRAKRALLSDQSAGLGLLGSGMAGQAAQIMQSRPYQLHVQEMQALGQQPMTPDQFLIQQTAKPR
jgi:hypothetical protein